MSTAFSSLTQSQIGTHNAGTAASSADAGTILERTRNLLSNHRIPLKSKSKSLAELSLSSKKLASNGDISQDAEHSAQLFFAQRGYDLSKHIRNVLTTQQAPLTRQREPIIDFDTDYFVQNQQDVVLSNLLQHSLDYQSIISTDIFSNSLCSDWNATKQQILANLSYTAPLPTPQDPTNSAQLAHLLPFSIPTAAFSNNISTAQELYAQAFGEFANQMTASHREQDLTGVRENILSLPQQLSTISRELEQREYSAPFSTTHVSSSGSTSSSPLSEHQQLTEIWMWFESLAQVLALSHTQQMNKTQMDANTTQIDSTQRLQYRYKNWFLHTRADHGVIATMDYLHQSFIEHMSNTISQDHELSQEYQKHIEYINDDNALMVELCAIYCQTRDFQTRFLSQQHSSYNPSNSQYAQLSSSNKQNALTNPNTDISRGNIWCLVYCCIRSGYYSAAIKTLVDLISNPNMKTYYTDLNCSVLVQILKLYETQQENEPTAELQIPSHLWVQLYNEMNSPTSTTPSTTSTLQDATTASNPFRKTVYSILGHFPLLPTEMKQVVTPYVLTTIEDFIWYRLRLITQQSLPSQLLDSYRVLSSSSTSLNTTFSNVQQNTNLLNQLSLSSLQSSILTRGKGYFANSSQPSPLGLPGQSDGNPLLYIHVLFLTQQFERALVELYTVNPVLAFHVAVMCLLFGLIRVTDISSDILIPINISLTSLQQLQSAQNQPNGQFLAEQSTHFGMTLLQQTHHARYAINMYKLITNYVEAIQFVDPKLAAVYSYFTRFIPLFGNIHLYAHYIQNHQNNTQLISLEYNVNMTFSKDIPKNVLQLYHNTILNINTQISQLILTHDQLNLAVLQNQFTATPGQSDAYQSVHQHCGVELPLMVDLLLTHKADGSQLLGPNQSLYNFSPILPPASLNQLPDPTGILYDFYPVDIIAKIVQITIARDQAV